MGDPADLPNELIREIPDEPWFVVFTQDDGGLLEYDTNYEDPNLAVAMVQKGLYIMTEDALDDDFPEDESDEDEDDDDDLDSSS